MRHEAIGSGVFDGRRGDGATEAAVAVGTVGEYAEMGDAMGPTAIAAGGDDRPVIVSDDEELRGRLGQTTLCCLLATSLDDRAVRGRDAGFQSSAAA